MKAGRYYAAGDIRVEQIDERQLQPGEVRIEVEWAGICGSDRHAYEVKFRDWPVPYTLGHEFSGIIIEAADDVRDRRVGERVVVKPTISCGVCPACKAGYPNLCRDIILYGYYGDQGAFAERTIVPHDIAVPISDGLSFDKAALVEPAAIAFRGLRSSRFKPGDSAVVLGGGPIGLLLVSLLRASGATEIVLVKRRAIDSEMAAALGVTAVINTTDAAAVAQIKEITHGGPTVVFDTAGGPSMFEFGLKLPGTMGEVVLLALSAEPLPMRMFDILSTGVSVKASKCTIDEFPLVVRLLALGNVVTDGIVTKKILLDDLVSEGFETLVHDPSQLKILVTPKRESLMKLEGQDKK